VVIDASGSDCLSVFCGFLFSDKTLDWQLHGKI
jgi:hypothetical protein